MSQIVIKASNISKAYQLGEFSTGTLSRDIQRSWALMRGKEDPYLKIGETNDRATKGNSNMVWSLKEIDFEINQGDAVGIIGRNGAGKSTLLKVLSRVTSPTSGIVKVKGRIASLLEVGTGFHPELTGKENIYLNGAILGMRRHEIKKHFDAIVDFAGVERYIDTPVKRYSSGMYVRLAFAVAAHLESEILIVDEVLAVGDAEFQKKCLSKMGDVSKGEGRTVLFVSHNMASVKSLCTSGIVLKNGMVEKKGSIADCISIYLSENDSIHKSSNVFDLPKGNTPLYIKSAKILRNGLSTTSTYFDLYDKLSIELLINCIEDGLSNHTIIIYIRDRTDTITMSYDVNLHSNLFKSREAGPKKVIISYPFHFLKEGNYFIDLEVGHYGNKIRQFEQSALGLQVELITADNKLHAASQNRKGSVYIEPQWEFINL